MNLAMLGFLHYDMFLTRPRSVAVTGTLLYHVLRFDWKSKVPDQGKKRQKVSDPTGSGAPSSRNVNEQIITFTNT